MSFPTTSWLRTTQRSWPPILAALTLTAALAVAPAVPASAHTRLTASTPANGARLSAGPAAVSFTFDQTLQPVQGWDAVLVTGPDGFRHPAKSVHVDGATVHTGCDRLGKSGTYTISYRVVSGDGHPVAGHITVTLDRPESGSSDLSALDLPTGSVPAWVWIVALAITLLALCDFVRWRSAERSRIVEPVRTNSLDATRDPL